MMYVIWGTLTMKKLFFTFFLLLFIWQDIRTCRIQKKELYGFAVVGIFFTVESAVRYLLAASSDGWDWRSVGSGVLGWIVGMLPGMLLLWLEHQTDGAVGIGDGYFFVIASWYLNGSEVWELLMAGVFVSSLAGCIWMMCELIKRKGGWVWREVRSRRLPFLPCLLPVWGWMLFMRVG